MSSPSTNSYVDAACRALKPTGRPSDPPKRSSTCRATRTVAAPAVGVVPQGGGKGLPSPKAHGGGETVHNNSPATPPAGAFTFGLAMPTLLPSDSPTLGSGVGRAQKAVGSPSSKLLHTVGTGAPQDTNSFGPGSGEVLKKFPVDCQPGHPAPLPAAFGTPSMPPGAGDKRSQANELSFHTNTASLGPPKRVVASTGTFGSIATSCDGEIGSSKSEVDHGAHIDQTDPPYCGPSVKNHVSSPPIIKTRRARAAEQKLLTEGKTSTSLSQTPSLCEQHDTNNDTLTPTGYGGVQLASMTSPPTVNPGMVASACAANVHSPSNTARTQHIDDTNFASLKSYSWNELVLYVPEDTEVLPNLGAGRYKLVSYINKASLPAIEARFSNALSLPIPLTLACRDMLRDELKSVARIHRVAVVKQDTKRTILEKLRMHEQFAHCELQT
ncbi:hypothetical protein H1R20_g11459, partial [Candolleomyces eurysporus]